MKAADLARRVEVLEAALRVARLAVDDPAGCDPTSEARVVAGTEPEHDQPCGCIERYALGVIDAALAGAAQPQAPHYGADGRIKHYCTKDYCPDFDENSMRAQPQAPDDDEAPDCGVAGCLLRRGHRGEHLDPPEERRPAQPQAEGDHGWQGSEGEVSRRVRVEGRSRSEGTPGRRLHPADQGARLHPLRGDHSEGSLMGAEIGSRVWVVRLTSGAILAVLLDESEAHRECDRRGRDGLAAYISVHTVGAVIPVHVELGAEVLPAATPATP